MMNTASFPPPAGARVAPLVWGLIVGSVLAGLTYPFVPAATLPVVSIVTKGLSVGLLAMAATLLPVAQRGWLAAILLAGALGDVLLDVPGLFFAGAGAFAIGHIIGIRFYASALRPDTRAHARIAGLALIGWGLAMPGLVSPAGTPVGVFTLYSVLLCAMATALLLSRFSRVAVLGALLFVVSDTLLIMRLGGRLVGGEMAHGLLVWFTYYGGQALIFFGVASSLPARDAA